MKTNDLIQLGALGLVVYLAYQKFGTASGKVPTSSGPGAGSVQPSQQTPVDFGLNDPTGWGDTGGNMTLQNAIDWAF